MGTGKRHLLMNADPRAHCLGSGGSAGFQPLLAFISGPWGSPTRPAAHSCPAKCGLPPTHPSTPAVILRLTVMMESLPLQQLSLPPPPSHPNALGVVLCSLPNFTVIVLRYLRKVQIHFCFILPVVCSLSVSLFSALCCPPFLYFILSITLAYALFSKLLLVFKHMH